MKKALCSFLVCFFLATPSEACGRHKSDCGNQFVANIISALWGVHFLLQVGIEIVRQTRPEEAAIDHHETVASRRIMFFFRHLQEHNELQELIQRLGQRKGLIAFLAARGIHLNAEPVISAGTVVRSTDGNVLVLRKRQSGEYLFPKGHVEENEKAEETARREANEEAGYDVDVGRLIAIQIRPDAQSNKPKIILWFEAKADAKQPVHKGESDVYEIAWLSVENALKSFQFDEEKDLLKYIAR